MAVFLYRVSDHERMPSGLALLPGIDPARAIGSKIKCIKHGSEIELRLPNGTICRTIVASYCVRLPHEGCQGTDLVNLPVRIVIPQSFMRDAIPIGTEVWLP